MIAPKVRIPTEIIYITLSANLVPWYLGLRAAWHVWRFLRVL